MTFLREVSFAFGVAVLGVAIAPGVVAADDTKKDALSTNPQTVELAQAVETTPRPIRSAAEPASTAGNVQTVADGPGDVRLPDTLPETASPLPQVALYGLLALASGLTLRFVAKRLSRSHVC